VAFDLTELIALVARHGPVARVVVAAIKGSVPREVGAAMLVWPNGQAGTIGGGALEFQAAEHARDRMGQPSTASLKTVPLGPELGQCCGGATTLLTEVFTAADCATLADLKTEGRPFCRNIRGDTGVEPLVVARQVALARGQGIAPTPAFLAGWMIDPFAARRDPVWIYGAGHVGRALVTALAPFEYDITWVDTAQDRFPNAMPDCATPLVAADPARAVAYAPADARHLVLTFSHAMDLEICHAILSRGFRGAGLIGSATKWARFRKRLAALGHTDTQINAITCPIGRPELGKSPAAIAAGVAVALLTDDAGALARPATRKEPAQ